MWVLLSVILWLTLFKLDNGTSIAWSERGGGGGASPAPPPAPPPPPSPTEQAQAAVQAQVDALPQIFQSQLQFAPKFTQLTLDQVRQFGPQFAEEAASLQEQFGGRLAEATRAEQEILAPERVEASRAIDEFLEQGPEDLTDAEVAKIQQDARAAAASRGLAESGFSGVDELSRLFNARQALKSRFLNVALAASGRLPGAGLQSVQASPLAAGPGQLVQNVSPSNVFGAFSSNAANRASVFGTQASLFNTQSALANQGSPFGQIAGSVIGAGLGALSGGVGSLAAGGLGMSGLLGQGTKDVTQSLFRS